MDNFRGLLCIRMIDRTPNARIRELCRVREGLDERIEGVLRWFGNVERMERDMIAKREYVGEYRRLTEWEAKVQPKGLAVGF